MKPKPLPVCITCGAPSIERPAPKPNRCAACVALERDIASQKTRVLIQEIRKLKAGHKEQEAA